MNLKAERIIKENSKSLKIINNLWVEIINIGNFIILKKDTINAIKELGFLGPKIKIKNTELYFNKKGKDILSKIVTKIYNMSEIKLYISYGTIHSKTINRIQETIVNDIEKEQFVKQINKIIVDCMSEISKFEYYRLIDGVELKGIDKLSFGDVNIFKFLDDEYKYLYKLKDHNTLNDFFEKSVIPFLNKYFSDKICIKTYSYGDAKKSEKNADIKFKHVLNMLRCLVCFKAYKVIYKNPVKINLLSESFEGYENGISVKDNQEISLQFGKSRKNLHSFPIDVKSVQDLKERFFFDDLISIIENGPKTEFDKTILTAMHWIGEAQNDFNADSAFVKYWTALETFYSKTNESIRKSLAKGISIQLAYGGYGFIKPDESKTCFKEVNNLYRKRSKIIHRGRYESVSPKELSSVCKYAIFSFFSFLGLRSIGYRKLVQLNNQINRLYYVTNYKYLTCENSKVYHKLNCNYIKMINPNKIIGIVDSNELKKLKKTECRVCFEK